MRHSFEFHCKYVYFALFSTVVVTIGFNATYSVQEDAGVISVSVFVLMNSLARDVVEVTLSTQDDTARGRICNIPNLQGLISEGVGCA